MKTMTFNAKSLLEVPTRARLAIFPIILVLCSASVGFGRAASVDYGLHTQPPSSDWSDRFTRISSGELVTTVADSHGAAWGDYDRDGDLDLFVANHGQPNFLFRNEGDGSFTRVTGQQLTDNSASSAACAWGDYDNDGDLDLLVGNKWQQPILWNNNGDGTFRQVTDSGITSAGGESYAVAWADYDNDGWLDLIILNTWNCNYLFHNNGNGTFTRITQDPVVTEAGAAIGCAWGDYDNDGWLDLFVAYGAGQNNRLYRNNRDGTFTRITTGEIVNDGGESVTCAWGDYDNDGWLDLFVANRSGNNFLYHNNSGVTFTKVVSGSVVSDGGESNGCVWADFDNDGWLDLFVSNWSGNSNFIYRNNGDRTFTRITTGEIASLAAQSIGCAAADYNGDGFVDLFVANAGGSGSYLFRNVPNANNWLKIRCIGTSACPLPTGVRVSVKTTVNGVPRWQTRYISSASGWSGGDPEAVFGLGSASNADAIVVEYPSGAFCELQGASANQTLQVSEESQMVTFHPHTRAFDGTIEALISTTLQDAEIHYTCDGSTPSASSPTYSKPISIAQSCTIKAIAYTNGSPASIVFGHHYQKRAVEGSIIVPPRYAKLEDDGWGNVLSRPERVQEVYAASHFPDHPIWIKEIRFRPNAGDTPKSGSVADFQLNLSTTAKAPDELSLNFAENLGPDDTVVYKGRLEISSAVSGPPQGPCDFDMILRLTTPFYYDPALGNLLLDFRNFSGGTICYEDGCNEVDDGASRVWSLDPSGPASTQDTGAHVLQFIYEAEEPSILFSPRPGTFVNSVEIILTSPMAGAEVHYTLDGSSVTLDSPAYVGPIRCTNTVTIRARAFLGPTPVSREVSATYVAVPEPEGGEGRLVVPSRFQTVEDDGWGNVLSQRERVQEVYASRHFPRIPIWIREIRFRPNLNDAPKTGATEQFELTLSTTARDPDALSVTFGDNVGPDETVVYKGSLTITTTVTKSADGPCVFDMPIQFTTPFYYDPSKGNLLLDFKNFSGGTIGYEDGINDSDDGVSRAWSLDPNSPSGVVDTGGHVLEFIYTFEAPILWVSPPHGAFDQSINISMITSVPGGTIRFTLDGSEPTAESPAYEQPIRLSSTTTVKARVFVDGAPASDVVTGVYEITLTPPAITSELKTQTVVEGGNLTFTASVTGSPPLAYQWAFNGVPIASQTNNTLSLANVGFDNAGTYTLTVSNEVGTVSKDLLTLTVAPKPIPPTIVLQPKSIMVVTGSVATFTVVAAGTEPLSYQWRRGTTTVGMNSPTLTITDVKQSDAGTYRVKVLNPIGSVYSDYATLQVFDTHVAPQITSAPTYARVNVGERVVFSAEFTGTLPLACQWYKNGVPIEGATNSTLTIEAAQLADQGTYVLVVTNPAGSAATPGAVLYLWPTEIGGTVNFNNLATPSGVDAPIYDSDGTTKLSGAAFLAQLYAGKTPDQLVPVGPAVPFESGIAAGYVCQRFTSRTIPFVAPGDPVFVQVRVWETAFGATYEAAVLAGGKTGTSDVLNVVTGGAGSPPSLPGDLAGLKSFSVKRETVPPTVVIESPVAGTTTDERVTLTGVVTDNTRVESARWELNGRPMGTLALDAAGRFNQTGVRLHRGENVIRVVGRDSAGNEAAADVVVVWQPLRELALVGPESDQEGRLIDFDLVLRSPGDVAGLSFAMSFSTDQFRNASFAWSDAVSGASGQVNLDVPGEIQATLSLPGTAIPAGTVRLGTLSLRARSVPASQAQTVSLNLQDLADTLGNRILFGSDALSAVVTVLPRKIRGDNNGNDRLDIGDATVIQRYLVGLDLARPWDIVGNDLNQEAGQDPALDSGDVIKVLRAVVGLDPQPKPAEVGRGLAQDRHWALMDVANNSSPTAALHSVESSGPWATAKTLVSADRMRAAVGETLVVRVQLNDLPARISGAVFKLDYPGDSLVLREPVRAGAMVPTAPTPAVTWRTQDGSVAGAKEIVAAISSAQAWPNTSGVVAELTFEVAPTASFKAVWPVVVESLEVTTSDGYDLYTLPGSAIALNPLPILTQDIAVSADGVHGSFTGLSGSNYRVEVSNDLITWGPLATGVNTSGTVLFHDPFATQFPARFYRVIEW